MPSWRCGRSVTAGGIGTETETLQNLIEIYKADPDLLKRSTDPL